MEEEAQQLDEASRVSGCCSPCLGSGRVFWHAPELFAEPLSTPRGSEGRTGGRVGVGSEGGIVCVPREGGGLRGGSGLEGARADLFALGKMIAEATSVVLRPGHATPRRTCPAAASL